jgi:hypothetical protein
VPAAWTAGRRLKKVTGRSVMIAGDFERVGKLRPGAALGAVQDGDRTTRAHGRRRRRCWFSIQQRVAAESPAAISMAAYTFTRRGSDLQTRWRGLAAIFGGRPGSHQWIAGDAFPGTVDGAGTGGNDLVAVGDPQYRLPRQRGKTSRCMEGLAVALVRFALTFDAAGGTRGGANRSGNCCRSAKKQHCAV